MSEDQWGPWIEHDGKGCPCGIVAGDYMQAEYRDGELHAGRVNDATICAPNWIWPKPSGREFATDCIRYRIRKPRGLTILERVAQDVTAPIKERVE